MAVKDHLLQAQQRFTWLCRERQLEASMDELMLMKTLGHGKNAYRKWKQSCETWKGYIDTLNIQGQDEKFQSSAGAQSGEGHEGQ